MLPLPNVVSHGPDTVNREKGRIHDGIQPPHLDMSCLVEEFVHVVGSRMVEREKLVHFFAEVCVDRRVREKKLKAVAEHRVRRVRAGDDDEH